DYRNGVLQLAPCRADCGLKALSSGSKLGPLSSGQLGGGKPIPKAPQLGLIRLEARKPALIQGRLNGSRVHREGSVCRRKANRGYRRTEREGYPYERSERSCAPFALANTLRNKNGRCNLENVGKSECATVGKSFESRPPERTTKSKVHADADGHQS